MEDQVYSAKCLTWCSADNPYLLSRSVATTAPMWPERGRKLHTENEKSKRELLVWRPTVTVGTSFRLVVYPHGAAAHHHSK